MLAAFIFVISMVALIHFGVCYLRAIMASVASEQLSARLGSYLGGGTRGDDTFGLTCILSQLCPEIDPDVRAVRPRRLLHVRAYHCLLGVLQSLSHSLLPSVSTWAGREMDTCSRYAAVIIDHRMARNLEAIARIHAC
jgi:hypothetical protein